MKTKGDVAAKRARYARLVQLTQHPGWKEFETLLREEYVSHLEKLKEGPNEASRGVVVFVDDVLSKFASDLRFGKIAADEYQKQLTQVRE